MKIILLKDIRGTGRRYEVVDVSPGYARNFLIPQGLAKIASQSNLQDLENRKREWEKKREREMEGIRERAEEIEGTEIVLKERMNEEGVLFGSVDDQKIKQKLEEEGYEMKQAEVVLEKPIKETGEWKVIISFPHNLEAEIKLVVEGKNV